MHANDLTARFPEFRDAWFPEDEDQYLDLNLRVWNTWNEERFQRMVSTGSDVLAHLDPAEVASGNWAQIFDSTVKPTVALMTNPVVWRPESFTPPIEDFEPFVRARIEQLEGLRQHYLELRDSDSVG